MRTTVTVVAARHGVRQDALIEAPAEMPTAELLAELGRLVNADAADPAVFDRAPAKLLTPVASSGLRDGTVVSFGPPGAAADDARHPRETTRGYLELRVVGGPSAGGVHLLRSGENTIGRGGTNVVDLDDPNVSRRHAVVTVSAEALAVADAGSTNGTRLEGVPVGSEPIRLEPGMRIRVGDSTLTVGVPDEPPVAVAAAADGRLSFNRPPRLDAPDPNAAAVIVELPVPLQERAGARLPVIATIAPLVAGVVLALVMRRPEYLLFTVLSPLMMLGQWLADRAGHRRTSRAERAAHESALREAQAKLAAALAAEEADRRRRAPDPAVLQKMAAAPTTRLWERRRADADFVQLRLGSGTLPAQVRVHNSDEPVAAHDVPVTVALRDVGVLGIAGPPERTAAIARALVGQLATLHSPRDLGVVLLTEPARAESWEWIRWLPHLRPAATTTCQALVGLDRDTAAARVAELATLITARRHATTVTGDSPSARTIVVLIDGARALRGAPGLADVLSHGPDADVLAICLDAEESQLPEECGAVATFTGDVATRLALRVAGGPVATEAIADGVSVAWAERVGRALAPLRDDSAASGADGLPDAVRWLEVAGLENARGENAGVDNTAVENAAENAGGNSCQGAEIAAELVQRWRRSAGGSSAALIGVGLDGPFTVDIARDGPHALVAGTTGSGKSELLQTLVASLAVANRPDELTFVLVDYKGGAAFGSCAALPHTVGLVTDLDGSLVERALVSLSAELKRREALLAAAGVPNIDGYRSAGHRLARLVIVVDEFASLVEELPDFVGGLVGIAQRGRSLGVHLVLATQRPEGVVSADIRANTNLRICLAVMRDSESRDVIDAPDAARISRNTPGRGYARTGHGELHAFQCGRVGGAAVRTESERVEVRLSPFRALGLPEPARQKTTHDGTRKTDLDLVVDACREAAIRLDVEIPASPWLAPLAEVIVAGLPDDRPLTATLGVRDVPCRQAREPYALDLATTGHFAVAGSPRSGRSTTLRTIAGTLARSTSTADLHVYAFDCGGGSLAAFSALPHSGAVVSPHEPERARRLMTVLVAELVSRQTALAAGGFGSITEQRSLAATPLPHVVVFIDGWEGFLSSFEDVDAGAVADGIFRLLREGAAVGIHVIVSADRGALVGRLASAVENRLVLRLADRGDFALLGMPARTVPAHLPPGRGFNAHDLVETQVCLLDADPSGPGQLAALAEIAASAVTRDRDLPPSNRPRRIEPLPTDVTVRQLESRPAASRGSGVVTLGVGGDELDAVRVDLLESGPGFVIAGPPRSGRSTALATIALGLRDNGWRIVAVTSRPSPLTTFADVSFDAADPGFAAAIGEPAQKFAVLVDDAELVPDTAAAPVLDRLVRSARDHGHLVALAGTTDDLAVGFRGFVVDARRSRAGLLLTPRGPLDGEVLGVRLPRDTGGRLPVGRALLVRHGETTLLQVARPC